MKNTNKHIKRSNENFLLKILKIYIIFIIEIIIRKNFKIFQNFYK